VAFGSTGCLTDSFRDESCPRCRAFFRAPRYVVALITRKELALASGSNGHQDELLAAGNSKAGSNIEQFCPATAAGH